MAKLKDKSKRPAKAKKKKPEPKAPELENKTGQRRPCFQCNGTGEMCNCCGESQDCCDCTEDDGEGGEVEVCDFSPCDSCGGIGIAILDQTEDEKKKGAEFIRKDEE